MALPKISIITAVLNCEKFIERAMQSVFIQEYPNLEYIIIDGKSTDGTLDVIEKYREKIDHFISEPDGGNAEAQIKGVKLATGDYVAYLAADDWYEEGTVKRVGALLEHHPDAQVVTCGARSVTTGADGNIKVINTYSGKLLGLSLESVLASPLTNSRFFKKDIFDEFGFPNNFNERGEYFLVNDREFMIRLALGNIRNYAIENVSTNFFGHSGSMTLSGGNEIAYKIFQEYLDIYEDYLDNRILTHEQRKLFKIYHRKESIRSVWRDIKNNKYARAWKIAKRGMAMNHIIWVVRFLVNPIQRGVRKVVRAIRKMVSK
jgi:glycosyltransferase involved in cell wall biosynthesis